VPSVRLLAGGARFDQRAGLLDAGESPLGQQPAPGREEVRKMNTSPEDEGSSKAWLGMVVSAIIQGLIRALFDFFDKGGR
jgi:hypothetical protein